MINMPETYVAECIRHGKGWRVLGVCNFKGVLRTLGSDIVPRLQKSISLSVWKKKMLLNPNAVPTVYVEDIMAPGSWLQIVFLVDDGDQKAKLARRFSANPRDICGFALHNTWLDDISQDEYIRLKQEYIDA